MWFVPENANLATHPRRFWSGLVIVALLSFTSTGAKAGAREEILALLQQGGEFLKKGEYDKAASALERSVKVGEKALGPDDRNVSNLINNLAVVYLYQGRYAEAEPLYKRALAIIEKAVGPDHRDVAPSLGNLASVNELQGRFAEAEKFYKRGLAIEEKTLGPNHIDVAVSLGNLAGLYMSEGRFAEAEPLYARALAIDEKARGPSHTQVATDLNNLAVLYSREGRADDAETQQNSALAIDEKALGPDHPKVATDLDNLGKLYIDQGRYGEAEPLHKRALAIREKTLGPNHVDVAESLENFASLYARQDRLAEAEPLYTRALAIFEKALDPNHPDIARGLKNLAALYERQGRDADALAASRRAVAILIQRVAKNASGRSSSDAGSKKLTRPTFLQLVHLLSRLPSATDSPAIVDEAFRAAQYAGGIETAQALASMTARVAAGSDALAALVRDRQDLANRWRALDAAVIKALSQTPDKRNPAVEAALRREQAAIDARLKAVDEKLRADFSRFVELAAARPVGIADIQNLLDPGEVFVAWALDDKESYLFVVRKDGGHFFKLDMSRSQAADAVQSLRATLVSEAPFDRGKAYDLYKSLFGPAEMLVADARHLIIVPDGALQSLPPSVLVTEPGKGTIEKMSDYKSVPWLIRRQALTILPAASSLVSLRSLNATEHAKLACIGFGDPDFHGDGAKRGLDGASLYRGGEAIVDRLRNLPRLPETAGELRAEAEALGAPASSLHLGREASVASVKALDLSNVRVIAFATHGLIAGDLPQLAEPALVLSPPAHPTSEDDGLLRASQVSQLKLNADFVILSACNTAASDGRPGAEGLSGLAKAFFYAGARSPLVSHWPVDSDATVRLTTGLIRETAQDPSIGRAEALRRSILAMIDGAAENSDMAHPSTWAPFVLAGEGGAKR